MALTQNLSQRNDAAGGLASQRPRETNVLEETDRTITDDLAENDHVQLQLWHGQKLETLGRLAAGIAHDFGNLLTVILGYSELLDSKLSSGDPRHELVQEIQKASTHAERLTRQIRNFAGPRALQPQVLDLGSVLGNTEKMLRRLIGENILLSTFVPAQCWPVKVDPGQMQQIIVNLVVNARDAMPAGGTMTIEIAHVTIDPLALGAARLLIGHGRDPVRDLALSGEPPRQDSYVMLSVRDSGTGMNSATQARIFEPFFTTKAPGQGTGIGLSMVDDIVKQNGGHIDVETEIGKGSTFKVFLPRADESAPTRLSPAESNLLPRGNEVVLLVEDEESVRRLIRQVLELCGYEVLEAADGRAAIEMAEKHNGEINLLLSDVVLPHVGGRQLADLVRARHNQLKVLFLSGHPVDYVYEQGGQEAGFAFLQKPFTVGTLARKVRDVLNQ
jgi:signal transduction histidine kinase